MKRFTLMLSMTAVLFGLVAATGSAAPPFKKSPPKSAINWQHDLKAARKVAVAEGKPIMIVFGAEWCGYCKKLEAQTLNTPEMSQYINSTFVPVHLDLDHEKKIGEILEVQSLPCTIILSPDADLLGRINGYQTAAPYQKNLAAARQLYQPAQAVVPAEGTQR